jgi:1,4-dihydroxy-2-naphthoyl-CoA hydrolase
VRTKGFFILIKMEKKELLQRANAFCKNTLMETLEIEFTDIGDDFLTAEMPVTPKVHQPDGLLHGGATAALAESVGSAAVFLLSKRADLKVRGIEISANHLRSVTTGKVIATARPMHWGNTIQLWEIRVVDQENQLISLGKLTTLTKFKSN